MTPLFDALPPVQKRLLSLLQYSLWGKAVDPSFFGEIGLQDWKELMELAARQGVFALAYDGLAGLPETNRPPKALLIQWAMGVKQIERRYDHQVKALQSLTKLYSDNGIKSLLIKGIGLSQLYPKPEHRESGDLDLFLFGDYDKGNRLMEERGIKVDTYNGVHSNFDFEEVPVENHRTFLQVRKRESDRDLELLLHQYLSRDLPQFSEQFGAYLPPLSFNLLFLFKHAVKHFLIEGIVLRQLVDWALVLHRCSDPKEYRAFYESVRQHNMHGYADAFYDMAVDCLGLPENRDFVRNPDLPFTSRVLADIFQKPRNDENLSRRNIREIVSGKMNGAKILYNSRWKYHAINNKMFAQELMTRMSHFFDVFRNLKSSH